MINEIYILNQNRERIALIDDFSSIIWDMTYYDVGNFEIYAKATPKNRQFLIKDNFVWREDREEPGIIEQIEITFSIESGYMITASGRFAKSVLDRRIIYNLSGNTITPVVSRGNVEIAVRTLVKNCLITAADATRNVSFIKLGALANLPAIIETSTGDNGDTQTSYKGLLDYTENLLKTYGYGAKLILVNDKNLYYIVYSGTDRSITTSNPIIFSQEFDNLLNSDYLFNQAQYKNVALCGGAGEGTARKYVLVGGNQTGLNRRETFIDGSSNSETYTDEQGQTQTYSDSVYLNMLKTTATAGLSELIPNESFKGDIDIVNTYLKYGIDYNLGDIVTVEDNKMNLYKNCRITGVTEVQDDNGYSIKIKFDND